MSEQSKEKWRANYLPAPHFCRLNHACTLVNKAMEAHDDKGFGCYLVGSSIQRRHYRDVDVRYVMSDAGYDRLFRNDHGYTNALWSLMCVTISLWLSQETGLPIDFQIQRFTHANEHHSRKDGHERQPLGIFHDYPGERPSDIGPKPKAPDEYGWMIELKGAPLWWTGSGFGDCGFGVANDGVRFARKDDAERVLSTFPSEIRSKCFVSDHMWCPAAPPEVAP